jgi:hypothetical protein
MPPSASIVGEQPTPDQCSSPTPPLTPALSVRQPWPPSGARSWQSKHAASESVRGWSLPPAGAPGISPTATKCQLGHCPPTLARAPSWCKNTFNGGQESLPPPPESHDRHHPLHPHRRLPGRRRAPRLPAAEEPQGDRRPQGHPAAQPGPDQPPGSPCPAAVCQGCRAPRRDPRRWPPHAERPGIQQGEH